ncbi:MAG: hypothetical protein OMM_04831 [Candidatus Magnetoglobus multicellularis str. Araruama]|uniref:HEPN domain-containing protein n=1 Tax=Candidatus Magnetoglobus multicellularis str. Araruama TaxID=890399 RepID=A0A1V1NZG0_9BACT|nr:MAG: hypothetical protein OMM_04831 [Candidatus Magnetoglobus multicellularis str. Araruama]
MRTYEAKPWFVQAESDLRTANALRTGPSPMISNDVGCHVSAMCAQVVEKSIKGYVMVNGATPSLNHRPDKYLSLLLMKGNPLLRHRDHYTHLSKLFDSSTKHAVKALFELTPGGKDHRTDVPNTEYPWQVGGAWKEAPAGSTQFNDDIVDEMLKLAKRIQNMLHRLAISALRVSEL